MQDITIAEHSGFCSGVKYSISLLDMAIKKYPRKRIAMYGPIVHNESVIGHYKKRDVDVVNSAADAKSKDIIVTRAHGITKQEREALEKDAIIIDGTCPKIQKIRHNAIMDSKDSMTLIYYGKADHPETAHVLSYIPNDKHFISCEADIEDIKFNRDERYSLYCQTTMNNNMFKDIAYRLEELCMSIRINRCICPATINRQKAAKELAQLVDYMIVIGGHNSSNTKELYNICKEYTETMLINNASQLKTIKNIKRIGITAGASTPDYDIKEVVTTIKSVKGLFAKDI